MGARAGACFVDIAGGGGSRHPSIHGGASRVRSAAPSPTCVISFVGRALVDAVILRGAKTRINGVPAAMMARGGGARGRGGYGAVNRGAAGCVSVGETGAARGSARTFKSEAPGILRHVSNDTKVDRRGRRRGAGA